MGLIKAGIGALGGVLADQWKEFFYCDALPADVLVRKGSKRVGKRSSNTKGSDNIISNGSGIAVADGQCMLIVEQGRIVEVCAEPGEYTFDTSSEPSIFAGDLGEGIMATFESIARRFTYGGDTGKDQRVYYVNTKEIMGNKFGTPSPIIFEVVNKRIGMSRTVNVRCNGVYSYTICDPLLFYTKVCGNVSYEYTRDQLDEQLRAEFISALQPAFGALAEQELRPAQLPAKANELKKAMNDALAYDWNQNRGIRVESIALNPIRLSDEDMKKITDMEDAATYGSNAFMMGGRMATATANAMEAAASNSAGAMTGFMGMNMAGGAMGGGFNQAQQFYQMGMQQQAQQAQQAPAAPAAGGWKCACGAENTGKFCAECGAAKPAAGWTCACGAVNKGKFCSECGAKKPSAAPLYRCDKCGWEPEDPKNPPKFCPECGDRFDEGDIR
ncbi:MAG: SPFH domain-containing protein [Oscillospiraceae bacterium]|nr:SPFH domain-containing protein [Oscillospiraceae bacterium]